MEDNVLGDSNSATETLPNIHERDVQTQKKFVSKSGLRRRAWALAFLIVGCGILWQGFGTFWQTPKSDKTSRSARAMPVRVTTPAVGPFDVWLTALGTVTPLATVSVKSDLNGKLVQIGYKEGQMVKVGDPLAEIDPRPYEYALQQAGGQLKRDQALLRNAQLDLDRYDHLSKLTAISQQQRDTQEAQVHQYEGTVEIDKAQINTATLNLNYCWIKAPVSGRVGLRLVDLGNYVTSDDATGIVEITQLQPISVVFALAEDNLPEVMRQLSAHKVLPVELYDRSGTSVLAKGTLSTADNQIDPGTGTVKFKAQFENADFVLFPGQFVNVHLLVSTLTNAIIVPTAAVQYGPNGPFVYVISKSNVALMRDVKLGQSNGAKIVVQSGIGPTTRVVIAGADRLRDKAKVTIETAGITNGATATLKSAD